MYTNGNSNLRQQLVLSSSPYPCTFVLRICTFASAALSVALINDTNAFWCECLACTGLFYERLLDGRIDGNFYTLPRSCLYLLLSSLRYANPYVWCAGSGVLSAQTLLDHCHRSPLPCTCYAPACFPAYLIDADACLCFCACTNGNSNLRQQLVLSSSPYPCTFVLRICTFASAALRYVETEFCVFSD